MLFFTIQCIYGNHACNENCRYLIYPYRVPEFTHGFFVGPCCSFFVVFALSYYVWGRSGRGRMVIRFTTTCAISANHR
jgi:hypothetical protein